MDLVVAYQGTTIGTRLIASKGVEMSLTNGAKPTEGDANPPKVVIRRSKRRPVVTPEIKAQLRANARVSQRRTFPELPEWRRDESD